MFVRLAMPEDRLAIAEMAKANIEETRPALKFSEEKFSETFKDIIETAMPTCWVVEKRRELIAFMVAGMYEYEAAEGLYTTQKVLYVRPEHRGSRAAILLMKNFIEWSKMLGANEIVGGNDNEFNSERTAKFLEHFGFKKVGFAMIRVL